MRLWRITLWAGCLLFASWASAQPSSQPESTATEAEALFAAAQVFYTNGDYAQALEYYQKVYALVEAPAVLFNIGQCHRLLNQPKEAISAYRSFLEEVPDTEYRQEIEARIQDLQALLAPIPDPTTAPDTTPATEPATSTPTRQPPSRSVSRFLPVVGLVGAGIGLGVGAHLADAKINDENQKNLSPKIRTQRLLLALGADLSFAAALGLGLVLALPRAKGELSVSLSAPPGGALLSLTFSPAEVSP